MCYTDLAEALTTWLVKKVGKSLTTVTLYTQQTQTNHKFEKLGCMILTYWKYTSSDVSGAIHLRSTDSLSLLSE